MGMGRGAYSVGAVGSSVRNAFVTLVGCGRLVVSAGVVSVGGVGPV